jgi:hypothetical protein
VSHFKLNRITEEIFGWLATEQIKKMTEEIAEENSEYLEEK